MIVNTNTILRTLSQGAVPIQGTRQDYDALISNLGDARLVLLGEATHGTHEFYQARTLITRRLIQEHGFCAVAVEADWPDAYRVSRYVRGMSADTYAVEALADFTRFPTWMWRNADVVDFVGWLRQENDGRPLEDRVGFYGLDLYSMTRSMDHVVEYLDRVDPEAAGRARERYACFETYNGDPQVYGMMTAVGLSSDCEEEVVAQLTELRARAWQHLAKDGVAAADEAFCAERNAVVALEAARYYRQMYKGDVSSWNLRDKHMFDTLQALLNYLSTKARPAKIVVWEHNSHIGDARATSMAARGEFNVGQLVRERYENQVRLVGFTTYDGTVAAASRWDGPVQQKYVRPALRDSFEWLFHQLGFGAFYLDFARRNLREALTHARLERAIGVIYRPETERVSHYFDAQLPLQFNAVIHVDHTRAVEPLERMPDFSRPELPETFPAGL